MPSSAIEGMVRNAAVVVVVRAPPASAAAWVGPHRTRGRYIVDANGDRFKLKAANWHGASGTWTGSGDVNDPANHHAGRTVWFDRGDNRPAGDPGGGLRIGQLPGTVHTGRGRRRGGVHGPR